MPKSPQRVADWEKLLAHAALLQARLPNAIHVGGAFLVVERNATRDFLDGAVLSAYLGLRRARLRSIR